MLRFVSRWGNRTRFGCRYRDAIRDTVAEVVNAHMNQKQATDAVAAKALELPEVDQARFTETVETRAPGTSRGQFCALPDSSKCFRSVAEPLEDFSLTQLELSVRLSQDHYIKCRQAPSITPIRVCQVGRALKTWGCEAQLPDLKRLSFHYALPRLYYGHGQRNCGTT